MTRDIRATRNRLSLSTTELARLVGVTNRTAHGWLAGRKVPEPVWRLLEIWDTAQLETIKTVLAQGYAVEVGPVTDEQKQARMSPKITLFYHPPEDLELDTKP